MKIRVHDIKDKELVLAGEEQIVDYPTLHAMETAGECRFVKPLAVNLTVVREYDHIRVQGNVATSVGMGCSRCLGDTVHDVVSAFTIFYSRDAGLPQDEEEVELAEQDLISATYEGDEIDFSGEIAEQVLLAIPLKPLCREDCRGLCGICGADLNVTECGCDRQVINPKFSALKNFKAEK
ncbi:YceD family protein [Geomobilimonas luticola]|uniref:DUF177 domain-containing protein n=1 Tax=Geomobilimonas luticola TaxID=1114878 RepID=A0ABS5SEZ0_9BACT|nr:DUF177 domain-containing protein [Geomobilimonas luticola]